MRKRTILTVEDDPLGAAALSCGLHGRMAATTVSCARGRGLRRWPKLFLRGQPMALVAADRWMTRMILVHRDLAGV